MCNNVKREFMGAPIGVTSVEVHVPGDRYRVGRVLAVASVKFNNSLLVRGIRIVAGNDGPEVDWPWDPFYKGDRRPYVVPLTRELKEQAEGAIVSKWLEKIK